MGFHLQQNKPLARIKKHGLDVCTRWTLLEHVQSGQVGFPLLLNKALAGVKRHGLDVGTRWTLFPSWVYPVEVLHHLLGAKGELHVLASNSNSKQQAHKKSLGPYRGSKPAPK